MDNQSLPHSHDNCTYKKDLLLTQKTGTYILKFKRTGSVLRLEG